MKKALFLDRDGVINKDVGYISKIEEFIWIPNIEWLIKYFNDKNFIVIVVTNQSGISKGLYELTDVIKLHNWINKELWNKNKSKIDDFFICPHSELDNCSCRKPKAGLIYTAIDRWNIDVYSSLMIGDKQTDEMAAKKANITFKYAAKY